MLTADDEPTIRWAITRRLDDEPGVEVLEVLVKGHDDADPPYVAIGIHILLGKSLQVRSRIDMPRVFHHGDLLNQIDEVAEQCKEARADFWRRGRILAGHEKELKGSGLRGHWRVAG